MVPFLSVFTYDDSLADRLSSISYTLGQVRHHKKHFREIHKTTTSGWSVGCYVGTTMNYQTLNVRHMWKIKTCRVTMQELQIMSEADIFLSDG